MDPPTTRRTLTIDSDPEPRRPADPDPLDCCGSGCVRCIFDVHDEAMERYREQHGAWLARRGIEDQPSDQS